MDQSRRRGLLLFDGRQDAECEERKQSNDDGNVVPSDEATAKSGTGGHQVAIVWQPEGIGFIGMMQIRRHGYSR